MRGLKDKYFLRKINFHRIWSKLRVWVNIGSQIRTKAVVLVEKTGSFSVGEMQNPSIGRKEVTSIFLKCRPPPEFGLEVGFL